MKKIEVTRGPTLLMDGSPVERQGAEIWRLFNAATFALAGKVAEKPDLTKQLHAVIDGTCRTAA